MNPKLQNLGASETNDRTRKIVILAGKKSHGPDHNGIHDYPSQARLVEDLLKRSELGSKLDIVRAEESTCPENAISQADSIVIISDGRDGDLPFDEATHLATEENKACIDAAVQRGAGVVPIHFATFASEKDMGRALEWQGAAFEWEKNGKRDWKSTINWANGFLDLQTEGHPILNGVSATGFREEYYHKLTFHKNATPLIAVRALPGDNNLEKTVAWSLERPDGGRSFGTTMGHSLDSFRHQGFRTLVLNGIVWSAGLEVPTSGLNVDFAEREEVNQRLGIDPVHNDPIRVTVLAGNSLHRWHNWPESTSGLMRAWSHDSRISAKVFTDPEDLVTDLKMTDVLVLNWCNWEDPKGMPKAAQEAIQDFTKRGGGVFVHHFANGACHASLPKAAASDWPWYRTLVRRVWEHRNIAPGSSSHDHYGVFKVRPSSSHPLVSCIQSFDVEDELYWRQHGTEPIEPLLVAKSNRTGVEEPLMWTYKVGQGRVVQSLLGHSGKTYDSEEMCIIVRRIVAFCAHREIHGSGTLHSVHQ